MKKTQEIIDNGTKIIHLNYTSHEKLRKEEAYEAKLERLRQENMKKLQADAPTPPDGDGSEPPAQE